MRAVFDPYPAPPRGRRPVRRGAPAGCGGVCLLFALLLSPAAAPAAEEGRLDADFSYGRITGDYDTGEESDLESFVTKVRWKFTRGEVRVSLPYLRLSGAGNVTVTPGGPIGNTSPGNGRSGSSTTEELPDETVSVQGIGDLRVRGEWHALQGGDGTPWITLLGEVKTPTADEGEGLGTGETDLKAGIGLMQPIVSRTHLLADLGYTRMGDPDGLDYENVVSAGAGLSRRLGSTPGRYAFAYLEHRSHPIEDRAARLDLQLGASTRLGTRQRDKLSGSVLVGLSETAEDYGLVLSYGRTF